MEKLHIALQGIEGKLEKIITLLELRNSIAQARVEMKTEPSLKCTCSLKGLTSAVPTCPVHG